MADDQTITVVSASGDAAGVSREPEITIVTATGVAMSTNPGEDTLADAIGAAMEQAIRDCLDAGIIDPDVMRERMLAAREAVLNA